MSATLFIPDKENNPKLSNRIWLNEVDPDGKLVDRRFIKAGYEKEKEFFRYRSDQLEDEAVIANLVEEAVYRASRATKKEPLKDVGGYLFRVFSNLADREIARNPRTVNCDRISLENLPHSRCEIAEHVINCIHVSEILDAMEPNLRWAIERRTLGYGVQEIANEMYVSADCLSTRMRRGLKQTLKRLLGDDDR